MFIAFFELGGGYCNNFSRLCIQNTHMSFLKAYIFQKEVFVELT